MALDLPLAELLGSPLLLLFWSNDCGFCQPMLPDLQRWDTNPPTGAPRLLVISNGSAEDNRALGLRSTVFLDVTSAASAAFQANGTPIAILIDAEGRVASPLTVGAKAVLALADPAAASPSAHG